MIETLYLKRFDRQPYYKIQVVDTNDNPVSIDASSVYTTMKNVRTNTIVTSRQAAVVTSGPGGCAEYRWSSSDTAISGKYNIEFEINPQAGGKFTVPANPDEVAEVIILDDLDGV